MNNRKKEKMGENDIKNFFNLYISKINEEELNPKQIGEELAEQSLQVLEKEINNTKVLELICK